MTEKWETKRGGTNGAWERERGGDIVRIGKVKNSR